MQAGVPLHRLRLDGEEARGAVRCAVAGDGSCFWHAVACCLNWMDYRAHAPSMQVAIGRDLRRRLFADRGRWQSFLRERGYTEDLAPDIDKMRDGGTYADDFAMNYTAHVLGIRITVVVDVTEHLKYGPPDGEPHIVLVWLDNGHFEPVLFPAAGRRAPLGTHHFLAVRSNESNRRRAARAATIPCSAGMIGVC